MRIAHVVNQVDEDASYGGPLRVAANLLAELDAQGHSVSVLAGGRGYGRGGEPRELNGVPAHVYPNRNIIPSSGFAGNVAPGLLRHLALHAREFDIVHVHLSRDLTTMPAALMLQSLGVPFVVQTHGMIDSPKRAFAGTVDALMTRRALSAAGKVLYLTSKERGDLDLVMRSRTWRGAELVNGASVIPTIGSQAWPDVPEVLYLSRVQERKRPLAFVDAGARILGSGVTARFSMVGPDEGMGTLVTDAISAIPGSPAITYEGPQSLDASLRRIAAAQVFVLPSVDEPFPMVILEAMAAGVPVVCTSSNGLASAVAEGGAGLVVPPDDGDALTEAIRSLLADPEAAKGMGENGAETIRRRFSVTRVAEALLGHYDDVLATWRTTATKAA